MFTSTGLFGEVPCPKGIECELINCIFSHGSQKVHAGDTNGSKTYDPFEVVPDARDASPPPAKRRRIGTPEATPVSPITQNKQTTLRVPRATELKAMINGGRSNMASANVSTTPGGSATNPPNDTTSSKPGILVKTATRPVSPPILSAKKPASLESASRSSTPGPAAKESLIPRQVAKPPAQHSVRNQSLQMLFAAMLELNKQAARGPGKSRGLSLSSNELTKLALDEEEFNALTCEGDLYRLTMGRRIKALKAMQLPEWLAFLTEKLKRNFGLPQAVLSPKPPAKIGSERKYFSSGLSSPHEEIIILRRLRTPLEGLEAFGYVTAPPSKKQIEAAKKANQAAAGYEKCDRCDTRFQVFPGRNDQGQLTTGGQCIHHWGKIIRPPRGQSGAITGQPDAYYSCCSAALGTVGCTTAATHVFNVKDPVRLAGILQFEQTPPATDKKKKSPVTFDCEMAYTTLGLELVRLTAVSWPAGDQLLDVLVRPYGEILDLNTRFSGVSPAQWAEAIDYANEMDDSDDTSEDGQLSESKQNPDRLKMVDSPAAARQLLFDLLTPDTPLLGHAIDNDLNSCRIVHPFIIDTVLVYPHPKGLPVKLGLRMLTGKYLNRAIQQGGEQGHDSKEDAVATGDLVKVKVAEEWQKLRASGWKFVDGALVEPETLEKSKAAL